MNRRGRRRGQSDPERPAWARPFPDLESAARQLAPWRALVSPVVRGTKHLPDPLAPTSGARP